MKTGIARMGLFGEKGNGSRPRGSAARRRSTGSSRDDPAASFPDDPLDPMLEVKKRARRRLIGAVALVVGAIVFVPMVFDSGQKPAVDDIVIQIPDKNSAFQSSGVEKKGEVAGAHTASGTVQRDVAGSAGVTSAVGGGNDLTNAPQTGSGSSASPDSAVATEKARAPADKPLEQSAAEPSRSNAGKAAASANAGSKEKKKVKADAGKSVVPAAKDDARALALLNGKMADSAVNGSAKASSQAANADKSADASADAIAESRVESKVESYAVQIGAFSEASKARSLRRKLSASGLKTYTEVVKTTQGRRTRLRLGPYPSREAADKAQERVKKLFALEATVVPL